ncbi:MAG TPA: RebB family R body protein [Acidobacteriaceae bacterium]|nr:RebB family R body protein [Acidobacteriaceae bacterium]
MAFPTAVNDQITDSVSQANLKVLGDAPAMGMGNLYVATSQALSNAAHNATTFQQQSGNTTQATNVQGLTLLYSLDTGSAGQGTAKIDRATGLGAPYAKGLGSGSN